MAHYLNTIRDFACDELEKLAQKGKIADRGDAQLIDWLTHTVKSIDTIEAMAEHDGDYSERGYSYRRYPYYDDMERYSEARRKRDSMGRYSREGYDDGRSYRGYSRDGDTMEHLHRMLDEAKTEQDREQIRRWISEAEKR